MYASTAIAEATMSALAANCVVLGVAIIVGGTIITVAVVIYINFLVIKLEIYENMI